MEYYSEKTFIGLNDKLFELECWKPLFLLTSYYLTKFHTADY